MEAIKTEFDFELTKKFKYSYKGDYVDASFITLKAPCSKDIKNCAPLKQAFYQALRQQASTQESREETENAEIDGDAIMMLMNMSNDVDMGKVLLHAKELFSSGVAVVEGETKLTKPLIDLMSIDDFESMTGSYLSNFILASALSKLNAK